MRIEKFQKIKSWKLTEQLIDPMFVPNGFLALSFSPLTIFIRHL
jgi:hypothetical protein